MIIFSSLIVHLLNRIIQNVSGVRCFIAQTLYRVFCIKVNGTRRLQYKYSRESTSNGESVREQTLVLDPFYLLKSDFTVTIWDIRVTFFENTELSWSSMTLLWGKKSRKGLGHGSLKLTVVSVLMQNVAVIGHSPEPEEQVEPAAASSNCWAQQIPFAVSRACTGVPWARGVKHGWTEKYF